MSKRDALGYLATMGGVLLLLLAGLINHEASSPELLGPTLRLVVTPAVAFAGLVSAFVGYRLLQTRPGEEFES